MAKDKGIRINGHLMNRQDFHELIQNLQATARALREFKEEGKEEDDGE